MAVAPPKEGFLPLKYISAKFFLNVRRDGTIVGEFRMRCRRDDATRYPVSRASIDCPNTFEHSRRQDMNDIQLTIFDCDGVLVDSEIIAAEIESELLRAAGHEISVGQIVERFAGLSWQDMLQSLERETGLPLLASLGDKTDALLDERLSLDVQEIEGASSALREMQYPRCVCSNTKSSRLDVMLSKVGLKNFFHPNIFSAKMLGEGRSKPKPDIFLFGAQQMGVEPACTVVVEDSVHGVTGARLAGMRIIGFTGASHTYASHETSLRRAGAEIVISRMADLPAAVQAIAGRESSFTSELSRRKIV